MSNLIAGGYPGALYVVHPRETEVQGIPCHRDIQDLPRVDLAVLAIPAALCPDVVEYLTAHKGTRAFIVLSAGFRESGPEGAILEERMRESVQHTGGCLIGPNCIGVLTPVHHSVFTSPIPLLDPSGCDLISSSGATAVYLLESAITKGLRFAHIFSVGNAAQTGVEDILAWMDLHFDPRTSPRIKLLYIEHIKDPDALLHHASSLIRKGCRIAAIKAGSSDAGKRAASSHTGAMSSGDSAVEALFRKAGIVRCYGREELATVGAIFTLKELKGSRFAIITHAGGPAVMLTDALSEGSLTIPAIPVQGQEILRKLLLPGASTGNPIDILATGTAEHLGIAIDFCEQQFPEADGIMVIFGTPGLTKVFDAYEVLHQKMLTGTKPIFPILPSVVTASEEVQAFVRQGHVNFSDEVILGTAVLKVRNTPPPQKETLSLDGIDLPGIRALLQACPNGHMPQHAVRTLLRAAGIPLAPQAESAEEESLLREASLIGYPLAVKISGSAHKTDIGGVVLHVRSRAQLRQEFRRLMALPEVPSVIIQPMLQGPELFIGASYEDRFGHVVICGLGGIFVEILQDTASGLAPLSFGEALSMIRSLKGYPIIRGARGQSGIREEQFAGIIVRLSTLLRFATEIKELDLNPLMQLGNDLKVVDARIRIEHKKQL